MNNAVKLLYDIIKIMKIRNKNNYKEAKSERKKLLFLRFSSPLSHSRVLGEASGEHKNERRA